MSFSLFKTASPRGTTLPQRHALIYWTCCVAVLYASQGYYEGADLLKLTAWLAEAALEAESSLLAALVSIPWPYKPSMVAAAAKAAATAAAASAGVPEPKSPNSFSYWAGFAASGNPGSNSAQAAGGQFGGSSSGTAVGFTAAQAGVLPGGAVLRPLGLQLPHERQLVAAAEMQRHRPNGYTGLVAPALYGEAGECCCCCWLCGLWPCLVVGACSQHAFTYLHT
jgi:hypothetical protein